MADSRKNGVTPGVGVQKLPRPSDCDLPRNGLDRVARLREKYQIHDELRRCLLSEFFSTAILLFGGTASTAQYVLSKGDMGGAVGNFFGWAISIILAVYSGFRVSGSHMNPAVSLFLALYGQISLGRVLLYSVVQTAGAFFGSFLTYVLYYDAISHFDGGVRQAVGPQATLGIFVPFPQEYLGIMGCVVDQVLTTAFLCMCVVMVSDRRNEIPRSAQPLIIGLAVLLLGFCGCLNAGYEINPARDIGPKLMALCVGYGWQVVSFRNYTWFLVPIVCPFIGAILGSWSYQIFIGFHIPDPENDSTVIVDRSEKNVDGFRA